MSLNLHSTKNIIIRTTPSTHLYLYISNYKILFPRLDYKNFYLFIDFILDWSHHLTDYVDSAILRSPSIIAAILRSPPKLLSQQIPLEYLRRVISIVGVSECSWQAHNMQLESLKATRCTL
jgi:hypothetical protein